MALEALILLMLKSFKMLDKNCFVKIAFMAGLAILMSSCMVPTSKDSYLNKFEQFVNQVEKEHENYTEKDWKWADSQFKKFSVDWYNEYSDELTLKEKLRVKMIMLKYKALKGEDQLDFGWDEKLKKDANEIRERIDEYLENDAEEDLEKLKEGLEEIGDSAAKVFGDIIESLEKKKD